MAPSPTSVSVKTADGLTIAALDWGGPGEPLLLLHPNGFCAGVFDPIARRLVDPSGGGRARFRPVAVDLLGHGASDKPVPPDPYLYPRLAADVVAVLDHFGFGSVPAVGVSLGGAVAIHVDRLQPGRIERMMLCEGIARAVDEAAEAAHSERVNFMVEAARRRRVVWPSRAEMIASYGSRPPLDALAPEALAAYIEYGTVERPDGQVELACPPEVEATIFGSPGILRGVGAAWEHLTHLRATTTLLAGTDSNVPARMFATQSERAGLPLHLIAGGHFFLHEDTARGVALIEKHLG